ncbi:MAG TPA: histidinol-phosphate transaminase [Candidatus Angelobacter sp.]
MLKPRQCVLDIHPYHSPLNAAEPKLRLDMNESTTGCSPRVLARLRQLDEKQLALYTPREPGERLVAAFLRLRPGQVLLTNGADEAIDVLFRGFLEPGDEVVYVTPAFGMYEIFARASGAKTVLVPAGPEYAFPLEGLLRAISQRTRVIVITNPNNPTGVLADRDAILQVVKAAPDTAVLLDEAYFEFCGATMLSAISTFPNLFVARTFSKAYGLAGIRLGALVGDAQHMGVLRRICSPFNVNACALECLRTALSDRKFVAEYVQQVRETRDWTRQQLELLGFKCWPSHGNFVLCRFGAQKRLILQTLRECGVGLRDRADCPGCARISIGTQKEMEHVIHLLKEICARVAAQPQQGLDRPQQTGQVKS